MRRSFSRLCVGEAAGIESGIRKRVSLVRGERAFQDLLPAANEGCVDRGERSGGTSRRRNQPSGDHCRHLPVGKRSHSARIAVASWTARKHSAATNRANSTKLEDSRRVPGEKFSP